MRLLCGGGMIGKIQSGKRHFGTVFFQDIGMTASTDSAGCGPDMAHK